jgi:hypothetical protein
MLKQLARLALAIAGVLLVLAICTWGVTFSASYKKCVAENREQPSQQEKAQFGYRVGTLTYCEAVFANENGEAIAGLSTIVLTVSTILLWIATRDTAKIAERSLNDLERPWLLVAEVDSETIFFDTPRLSFMMTNYGKQAAIITGISGGAKATVGKVDIRTISLKQRHYEEVGNTIAPGHPASMEIPLKAFEGTDPIGMLMRGDAEYAIRGIIFYEGLTKQRCETAFCWRYDPKRKRLVRQGGEAYNYAR